MNIISKINTIEVLKSQLLEDVSGLYSNMLASEGGNKENLDLLADMVIMIYLLSNELGTSNEGLDIKVINRLKLALISENNNQWEYELKKLKKHFE